MNNEILLEAKRLKSDDKKIIKEIYPMIEKAISANKNSYKSCIERFILKNEKQLYDYAPIDKILFLVNDSNDYFKSIKLAESEILDKIKTLYYWDAKDLEACKNPFSISQLLTLKYFMMKKNKAMIELSVIYLAFSGKFYASCFYRWFPEFTPDRAIMDYVVNYMLTKKFDLISEGHVLGAVRKLTMTWIDTYEDILLSPNTKDEDFNYIIHQLYERIYSFIRNISKLYYKAYKEKLYLTKDSDNYDDDNFRIANNNTTLAALYTEKTMKYITSTTVNYNRCRIASTGAVDPNEIKSIFENILSINDYLEQVGKVINILLADFMKNYPDVKNPATSIEFINHSIKAKPNIKDKDLLELKKYILLWLATSQRYNSIKTEDTQNKYYRAILVYIVLSVNEANKG